MTSIRIDTDLTSCVLGSLSVVVMKIQLPDGAFGGDSIKTTDTYFRASYLEITQY